MQASMENLHKKGGPSLKTIAPSHLLIGLLSRYGVDNARGFRVEESPLRIAGNGVPHTILHHLVGYFHDARR